jgi:hypothetical protein
MGKRELVLVVGFVLLGIAVYQFTAPPPPPGTEGFSVGGLIRNIRRDVKGPRETAAADSSLTAAVPASITTLRLNVARVSDVTITGEDRTDLAASLHVIAHGFDQAEADAAAKGPKVKIDTPADAIVVSLDFTGAPPATRTQPPPMLSLTLLVPKRLALRAEPHIGRFVVSNIAGAEIIGSRGETKLTGLTKDVRLTHTFGALDIAGVPALKLNARNSHGTIKDVAGQLTIDATSGELTVSGVTGPIELEGRNTDFTLETDERLKAPLRINLNGGELHVRGLRVEARIDGRSSHIAVVMDAPAPVTIYNQGAIAVTAPPGGYTLDAAATEGRITSDDSHMTATPDGADARASANIRGGGPTLTLRSTRGNIEIRAAAGK